MAEETFEPGARHAITVLLDPRREKLGKHEYTIDLDYEDGAKHSTRLVLYSQNEPDIKITPETIYLTVCGNEDGRTRFRLVDCREEPFEIKNVESSTKWLKVRSLEDTYSYGAGESWLFETRIVANEVHPGRYAETIVIHTNDPANERLQIPVEVFKLARVRAAPQNVVLTSAPSSRLRLGSVFLSTADGEEIAIESVEVDSELLVCSYNKNPANRQVVFLRCWNDSADHRQKPFHVRIRFMEPCGEECTVTVWPSAQAQSGL